MKPKRKPRSVRRSFDGILNRMPAKLAPLAMRRILPVLVLPEQGAAAPTLKPRVAMAILRELQLRKLR